MATTTPEADLVANLSFKVAATDVEAPGRVEVRADEGIVEAIVSITGIEDSVADIIEPGAYKSTLTKRKPKVIWHHSWEQPIGRILHIEELMPGDPRLPQSTKDGQGWPTGAGGLLATMQFNLKSERGREAFEAVRFYSESGECEWSIGYQVPPSASTRDKAGVRHIKSIELYEISFVLFGAASQTGTLGVKAAYEAAMEHKRQVSPAKRDDMAKRGSAMPDGSFPIENKNDLRNAIMAYGRAKDKAAAKAHIIKRARALGLTDELPDSWKTSKKAAVEVTPAEAPAEPPAEAPAETPAPDAPDAPQQDVPDESGPDMQPGPGTPPGTEPDVAPTPDEVTPPNTEPVADPVPADELIPDAVTEEEDQDMLIPNDDDDPEVAALIDGISEDEWNAIESEFDADDEAFAVSMGLSSEAKAITPGGRQGDATPVGTPGGRQNWVDKVGGLPRYIRMVAHALIRNGMTESRAIATAVATMKRWAAGGGHVSAKVQAAAAAALAEWEAKRGASRAKKSADDTVTELKAVEYDPSLEVGEFAGWGTKMAGPYADYPKIEGTFEERIDAVRAAVTEALKNTYVQDNGDNGDAGAGPGPTKDNCHIAIEGTWPDRVIATRHDYNGPDSDGKESFEMDYVVGSDGSITLSDPTPVKLTVYVEPPDGADEPGAVTDPAMPMGDMVGVPDMVEAALRSASLLPETKTGRVLSGVNEARLKGALQSLIAVLRQAGIDVGLTTDNSPVPDTVDTESTAPSANGVKVDPSEIAAKLAALRG